MTDRLHRPGVPVIETFGPTIQGEGPAAGRRCWFVRFGGCDYRCSWCDTMYAVDPAQVRANATRMTTDEITRRLEDLGMVEDCTVILSGGNPALHADVDELVTSLHDGWRANVHVETQGSVWRDWLADVDTLVVSPKPPSSGMVTPKHDLARDRFLATAYRERRDGDAPCGTVLKFVVFDETDWAWAVEVAHEWPGMFPVYFTAGTPVDIHHNDGAVVKQVLERYQWLCEKVAAEEYLDAVALPQLHVLAWGTRAGV